MAKGDLLERSNPAAEIRLLKDTLGRIWDIASDVDAEGYHKPKAQLDAEAISQIWDAALAGVSVHTDDGRDDNPTAQRAAVL